MVKDEKVDSVEQVGFLTRIKNIFANCFNSGKINKFKYLIVGVLFLVILLIFASAFFKDNSSKSSSKSNVIQSVDNYARETELRLENVLSGVNGIGSVSVFIYISSSETVEYKEDTETIVNGDNQTSKVSTVFDKNGNTSTAVVVVTKYPKIEGVLIVASGAHDVSLKLKIIDAISCVLSLSPSHIEVLEGKS